MRLLKPLTACAVAAVGFAVLASGPPTVASAAAAPVPQITCRSMQSESNSISAPAKLAGCNRSYLTGQAGTMLLVGSGPYPILWSSGKRLSLQCAAACGQPPSGFRKPSRCTIPQTREFDWVGSVATSVGTSTRRFIGDTVTFDVCLTSSFGIDSLVPGTLFTIAEPPDRVGYWLVGGDGGVFSFNARFYGSSSDDCAPTPPTLAPFVCSTAIGATPDSGGYTIVNPNSYGVIGKPTSSPQFGDATGAASCVVHPSEATSGPSVMIADAWRGIASTPSGNGFWLVGYQGSVATCGDAAFYGDSIRALSDPGRVGIAPTPDGHGYWVVASDGGVFSFGDARFYGSMGGQPLNQQVVGMAATPDGNGYWLVASDGGVFAFGDAVFSGSMGGRSLNAPMVGIAANPDGAGYWTVAADGGVFSFGGAPFEGSMGGHKLNWPIVGIAPKG